MRSARKDLLRRIMELEFTVIDFHLYLDTHPRDQRALRDHNEAMRELSKLKHEYARLYGPLMPMEPVTDPQYHDWIKQPWPWQDIFK